MPPTIPIGSRRIIEVYPSMYSPADLPSRLRAAPAKKRRLSAENGISSREAISGFPTLTDSSWASSSAGSSLTSGGSGRGSAHPAGGLGEALGALFGRLPEPFRRCSLRRLDRAIDVLGTAARHL